MYWDIVLFYCIATLFLLIVARFTNQLVIKTKLTDMLINRDNPAQGIMWAGYIFAVFIIISATLTGTGYDTLLQNIKWTLIFGIGGIILLALVAKFTIKIILHGYTVKSIEDGNIASSIVMAASFIATSLIISGSVSGDITYEYINVNIPTDTVSSSNNSWLPIIVFFIVGQISFYIITYLYRFLTKYDDSKEITQGNIAAGLSYAGLIIAIGIVVGNSLQGHFIGWVESFKEFGISLLVIILFYPIRQFIIQGIMLGAGFHIIGGRLDNEISEDKNIAAGVIEASTYIAVALLAIKLM